MMRIKCAYRMKMDCEVGRWMEADPYGVRCGIGFSICNAEHSVTNDISIFKEIRGRMVVRLHFNV
jgi:hypothetical protein